MDKQKNASYNGKNYKQTELGNMPYVWEIYKLKEISNEITERAGNREFETLSISAGIGFVNQANKFGKELSGKQYEKYTVLHKGDFSYNKGNSKIYPQGCIYKLNDRECAAVPNVFESFRLNKGNPEFFEQLFLSGFLNKQLFRKINHGVRDDGLLNLKSEDFYDVFIVFPPLEEQQKIAEILSTQDKVIELKEKLIAEKQRQKKYLMQQLLTGKRRLKGVGGEWRKIRLTDITELIIDNRGKTPPIEKTGIDLIEIASISNDRKNPDYNKVIKWVSTEIYEKWFRDYIKKGDILISTVGQVGITSLLNEDKGIIAQNLIGIRCRKTNNSEYIYYLLNSRDYWIQVKAVTMGAIQPSLKVPHLLNFKFYVSTNINEQTAIAEILSTADKEIDLLQKELEQEKQKKKALMQLLLTGIVRV